MDRVGLSVGAGLGFVFLQPLAYLQTSQVLAIDHHSILSTSSAGWLNTCGLSRPETVCGLMDVPIMYLYRIAPDMVVVRLPAGVAAGFRPALEVVGDDCMHSRSVADR